VNDYWQDQPGFYRVKGAPRRACLRAAPRDAAARPQYKTAAGACGPLTLRVSSAQPRWVVNRVLWGHYGGHSFERAPQSRAQPAPFFRAQPQRVFMCSASKIFPGVDSQGKRPWHTRSAQSPCLPQAHLRCRVGAAFPQNPFLQGQERRAGPLLV